LDEIIIKSTVLDEGRRQHGDAGGIGGEGEGRVGNVDCTTAAGDEEGYDDNGEKGQVRGGEACGELNVWGRTDKDKKEEEGDMVMVVEIDGDDEKDDGNQKSEEVEDNLREEL
jgi:hypothetical protein